MTTKITVEPKRSVVLDTGEIVIEQDVHFDVPIGETQVFDGFNHTGGRVTLGTHVITMRDAKGAPVLLDADPAKRADNHADSLLLQISPLDQTSKDALLADLEAQALAHVAKDQVAIDQVFAAREAAPLLEATEFAGEKT